MNIKLKFLLLFIMISQVLIACAGSSIFAAPTPTVQPTPTNDPLYAAKVVQAFWDALEANDIETAMAYVSDDIVCAGQCYFKGKQVFRSYVQGYLAGGYLTKISDLKAVGSTVTYSWEVYRNGLFVRRGEEDEVMQVEDGKIVYWENYHSAA
jgi:limonene-1,2-epoxide hydrolase